METLTTSSFDFAGVQLTGGISADGNTWVKAVDVQKAVGKPDNSYRDFLSGKSSEAILCKHLASGRNVEDGRQMFMTAGYNKPVAFILAESVAAYWMFQASKKNKLASALVTSTVIADLQRTIKETNGIQVTAAQHEQVRSAEREHILKSYIEAKLGIISEGTERQEAMSQQLTPDEYQEYCWVSNKVNIEMYEWQLANFHHDDQDARENQQQQVFDATYSRIKVGELAQIQAECNQYWSR